MSTTGRKPKSEILDQQPPRSLEAEKAVLGSLLLDSRRYPEVAALIQAGDFYDNANQRIFGHFGAIHNTGAKFDLTLLIERLRAAGDYDRIGGAVYLADISRRVATAANVLYYASIVSELATKRQVINSATITLRDAHNCKFIETVISESRESFERIAARGKQTGPRPILFGQLADDNPKLNPPIVHGLIRRGEIANIVSVSKVGKSWLAAHLALCIITGRKFLDTFECEPGRVLLVDNELHPPTIAFRFTTVANAMGIPAKQYRTGLDVLSLRGNRMDLNGMINVLEKIEPGAYQLGIGDAWYRFIPRGLNENENADVMSMYNELDAMAARLQCAWVNVHHSSKGSQSDKRISDVGSGAGAQSRAPDAHLILREHEEDGAVVFDGVVRSFQPVEPIALRWVFPLWKPDVSLDTQRLKGKLTATEQRQSLRDSEGIVKLAAAFTQGPATISILRGRTGLSKHRCERLLDQLEASGSVRWTETEVRGNACRQYEGVKLDNPNGNHKTF